MNQLPIEKVCRPCRDMHRIDRAIFRVVRGVPMCGGCVADMPAWCTIHINKQPPQWMHAVAFRDDKHLCQECLDVVMAKLKPKSDILSKPIDLPAPQLEPIAPAPEEQTAEIELVEEEEMAKKICMCGCGEDMDPDSSWKYKRGHKPKGGQLMPPSRVPMKVIAAPSSGKYAVVIAQIEEEREKLAQAIELLKSLS